MRFLLLLAFLSTGLLLSGCAAMPIMTGGSQDEALVEMSVVHNTMTPPNFNWKAGSKTASETCRKWGYQGAVPASGPDNNKQGDTQVCITGTDSFCAQRRISRFYQCTG